MDTFHLSKNYNVFCQSEKTRYGFRHLAFLYKNGYKIGQTKACYYNRTWESYTFQSVIHCLIDAHFSPQLSGKFKKIADRLGRGEENKAFSMVAAVASLGSLLCDKIEEKNSFKKRILSTVPGIDFPDDFSSLLEGEKEKRLDGAIGILQS